MFADTFVPLEKLVGSCEDLKVFIIIYRLVSDDCEAHGDFHFVN